MIRDGLVLQRITIVFLVIKEEENLIKLDLKKPLEEIQLISFT